MTDEPTEAKTTPNKANSTTKSLLTNKENQAVVKDFAIAYLSGQIKIAFPDSAFYLALAKTRNEKLSNAEALQKEIDYKRNITERIAIVLGAKKATQEELDCAISRLFYDILISRAGDRIEGQFFESDLQSRVKQLEIGLEKANKLLDEVADWLMKGH
jgi:hypothetical protein